MFTKKSHQDVKKSSVKIQDSKKDSATRLKHLKIILEHYDTEEAKNYFETNFSHVYFILYDNFIQAENNLKQRELPFHLVHKAGREELEGALSLLEKVLCLLPELIGKRWQLHSLTRIFSKLLHSGNSQKLRAEAIRYFLLWYQALGENAPTEVNKMFATLVPGLPEPYLLSSGTPLKGKQYEIAMSNANDVTNFNMEDIMQHPNFTTDNAKKIVVEQTPTGIMGKIANVSASIFHDTNALNPVQSVEIQPLLPASSNERPVDNETKYFFEILLDGMSTSITKIQWKDRSHMKSMRCFAFLLEKFKLYYLPIICPQFNHKNSLYKPNLELPVQHNILEDEFVVCRVSLIKWVSTYAHFVKRAGGGSEGQPGSLTSTGSHPQPHEEETSFTVGQPSDSSRASSHDSASNTPHPSLDSGAAEEVSAEAVVRDVLCCWSRELVDFTLEVLRQAFLLPFAHGAAVRRVIALYKDWIQMNVSEIPPFLLESTAEAPVGAMLGEPAAPPRRLRNDSYLGAVGRDNVIVRAGMQNILQVFMTQAANVFLASGSPVPPPGALGHQHQLEEQTDTCKRVLNIYRYMVMHVAMDDRSWEQLLLVLLQITSLVLTKVPPKRKQETLGGFLAPALFQTLIVTWIKANLNVAVKPELWQSFMDLLTRLTHWEDLIKEWAKTMETLTRVLARHVYSLDLSEVGSGDRGRGAGGAGARRAGPAAMPPPRPQPPRAAPHQPSDSRTPGKSPRSGGSGGSGGSGDPARKEPRRPLPRARSEPRLAPLLASRADEIKEAAMYKTRRWYSLESLRNSTHHDERDSASASRSPSPAPSSGVESSSIKDSPLQIDLASDGGNVEWSEHDNSETGLAAGAGSAGVGVVLGGRARGWLPAVAAVLWRRMLCALGDPNNLKDHHAHHQLYTYLVHLNDTLLKISANQSLNGNTEIHVPFNLVAGWCLEAESLPASHRAGKLLALRLLCESTAAAAPGAPSGCGSRPHLAHLHLYLRALHHGLTGEDRSVVDVLVERAAPRFVSLAPAGYSLLLLDFVHAATVVLNSADMGPSCPRTAAVTFLGSLLALPDELMNAPMLQPYPHQYNTVSCPDLKEHVLNIVVRVCRREGAAAARCAGASALAAHCTALLAARRKHERLPSYVTCLLQMLMMKNKNIAKVVSDSILVLADYTDRIVELYPGLAGKMIKWICACLAAMAGAGGAGMAGGAARDAGKPLAGSLLLCLAELAVRCGPAYLIQEKEADQSLLLIIFKTLYAVMRGSSAGMECLTLPTDEDFDPNVQLDNLGPKTTAPSTIDVKLWAQTICTQLVLFLGQWPLWSGWQVSASVCEHHDGPAGDGDQLGAVLDAPHVLLLRLADTTLASFVELPALQPAQPAGTTPGLAMSMRQVRILLRGLAGKACWDASALYYDPAAAAPPPKPLPPKRSVECPRDNTLSSLPPPLPPDLLPDYKNSTPDKHQLDHVLSYIGHTSREVVFGARARLDAAGPPPLPPSVEAELVAALAAHRNVERNYLSNKDSDSENESDCALSSRDPEAGGSGPFAVSRRLVAQLGTAGSARRKHAHLLRRSDRLLRDLRNLDAQRCRETHKVAVIYVGKGQETRNEILSNRCGSPAYEAFLAALAWEVELESHVGFAGGLRSGGGGGTSAPYVASLTLEALFHVATRMPADTPDAILNKTRHLGNDEVHVVWSEHWRAYRRDTLPTQFCDVLVAMYPLPGGLLRCTVSRKPDVGVSGPLWSESVVRVSSAAALVRGAAVSGGRAVRATMPLYQHAYSERARELAALHAAHTLPATFEQFVQRIRDPQPPAATADDGSARLAAALLDHGAAWAPTPAVGEPHAVSPRPAKRLGPFKRPTGAPPGPQTAPPLQPAPAFPAPAPPPPAPAPRRNR